MLEALIKSGSLDGLAANRATLMHRLDAALALGEQNSKANETGQHDIFGLSAAHVPEAVRATAPDQPEWTDSVRLRAERETLGRAISGHPIDRFVNDLPRFITGRIVDYIDAEKPAGQRRGRPRVLRRQAGGDRRRGRGIAQARPAHRSGAGRRLRPHRRWASSTSSTSSTARSS